MKKIIEAVQGTAEWHAHRAKSFNASEAGAMLGMSSYKTRSQLLREKATGITPEIDDATQRRFDLGHEYEEIARPWAEEILGSELFPVVLSEHIDGLPISASLDGLTMMGDAAFEHKTLNASLAASLEAGIIPDQYHPQMEQCLMLSGAPVCLFMASSGIREDMRFAWYHSQPELRKKIIAGWKQFDEDVKNYQHVEERPAVVVASIEDLPALNVQISGSVVASNLGSWRDKIIERIKAINTDLQSDEDFAIAEKTTAFLSDGEKRLDVVKASVQAQAVDIDEVFRVIAALREEMRAKRLSLEKLVKARKESIRMEIMQDAQEKLAAHVSKINDRIGWIDGCPIISPAAADFATAMKGKKTVASLRDACDAELARAKIAVSELADRIESNIKSLKGDAHDWSFLFPDLAQVCAKANDDFAALLAMRIAQHKEAEEKRRRIAEEEREKADAAQQAVVTQPEISQPEQPAPIVDIQAAVIEHQDEISTFLKERSFKDESRIRAILVEFVKFQASSKLKAAA